MHAELCPNCKGTKMIHRIEVAQTIDDQSYSSMNVQCPTCKGLGYVHVADDEEDFRVLYENEKLPN
jgi:RecJ-like exonuclease